ncbi:hypothetical protein PoB_002311300 [Plakobranchus ocellatus]|uniref:Uncharacterized protein n=1 Tax=Plakobranchus ocellatus TaxID=259542 RepID=A0AAV3ZQ65_9GAST|nr:hypothetical protein PoB_002311300 [Plakobranchus ocellatus]
MPGLSTKYVEQEEICIQFLYCSQCIKLADLQLQQQQQSSQAEVVGAQVQLAAGSGARFSKGQIWLFSRCVKREMELCPS